MPGTSGSAVSMHERALHVCYSSAEGELWTDCGNNKVPLRSLRITV